MKKLTILFLLISTVAKAAVGDLLSATVETNGWQLLLKFSGMETNGNFYNGFSTNELPLGNQTVQLDYDALGFKDDGSVNTERLRTYGRKVVRLPYPQTATPDQKVADGTNVILRVALSDYVHPLDTNFTLVVKVGAYTNSVATNTLSNGSVSVVNNSAQNPVPPIVNWSRPSFTVFDSSTNVTVGIVGFQDSARENRPIRAIKYTLTIGTNTYTQWATKMTFDPAWSSDAFPSAEYLATFDLSAESTSKLFTVNAIAFPWIGDTNAVKDTTKAIETGASWKFNQRTNLYDFPNTYGRVYARVATNGVDASGVAVTATYWATNQSPAKFATIGAAMKAIAGTNNAVYSRNNCSNGRIKLDAGTHSHLGSALTLTVGQDVETLIEPMDGVARADVIIIGATDARGKDNEDIYHYRNVTFNTSASTVFSNTRQVWIDNCDVQSFSASAFYQCGSTLANELWFTQCTISNVAQGLRFFSTQALVTKLRGNRLVGTIPTIHAALMIGNYKTNSYDQMTMVDGIAGYTAKKGPVIVYNNWLEPFNKVATCIALGDVDVLGLPDGAAVVQNVFITTTNNPASTAFGVYAGNNENVTNYFEAYNVWGGPKRFYGYTQSGSNRWMVVKFKRIGNVSSDMNIKSDDHAGDDFASGERWGNWSVLYAVGDRGNVELETAGVGAPGSFLFEIAGIGSAIYHSTTTTNFPAWVNYGMNDGVATISHGQGDYRLLSKSPLHIVARVPSVLPYDLFGRARPLDNSGPPGPSVMSNPKQADQLLFR